MQNIELIRSSLLAGELDERLREVYVDEARIDYNRERLLGALDRFRELFPGEEQVELYSAPGRSEVCGNHTDHQNGRVLAAATVACPPAVPVVVCGERIDRAALACFRYYGITECTVVEETR